MMIPRRMLRHTISVKRLTQGEGIVRSHQEIYASKPALVLPADPEATMQYGIAISQGFKIYTNPEVVLKVSDKIEDNRGRIFQVRGVSEYDDFDSLDHHSYFCEMIGRTSDESEEEGS